MESNHNPRLLDAIFHGRKIEAIKLYRELNAGMGLKEAKEAIEKLASELHSRSPDKFTKPPAGHIPVACIAILLLIAGIVAYQVWQLSSK